MNLLISLIAVLLVGGSLSAVYHMLIRPAFIFWLRRSAMAVRDDLRFAVLAGEIGEHEKSVQPTSQKLDALIGGCEHVGIMSAVLTMRSDATITLEAERDAQLGREAGAAMKEIIRRADMLVVATIVLNSPFFWLVLPPIYAVGTLTGKITRWINSVSLAGKDGHDHGTRGGLVAA